MKKNNDYWFTIEPYTYVYFQKNEMLFFNTLDGSILKTRNKSVIKLVKDTVSETNLSVSYLSKKKLDENDISAFINELRELFMGDIIEIGHSSYKPIQFISQINILNYNKKKQEYLFFSELDKKNLISYLDELTILINGSEHFSEFTKQTWYYNYPYSSNDCFLDFEAIKRVGKEIEGSNLSSIKIIGSDFMSHPQINDIIEYFKPLSVKMDYIQYNALNISDLTTSVIYDLEFVKNNKIGFRDNVSYSFIVTKDEDLSFLDSLTEKLEDFIIIPYFTGNNLSFFEKNIYIKENDLSDEPQHINDIFAKQFINLNQFGKLFIDVKGDIYSNLYVNKVGNIDDSLKKIILKEMTSKCGMWRNTRDKEPCCNCIYQWICPTPSNYETAIGKHNLCHINNNK